MRKIIVFMAILLLIIAAGCTTVPQSDQTKTTDTEKEPIVSNEQTPAQTETPPVTEQPVTPEPVQEQTEPPKTEQPAVEEAASQYAEDNWRNIILTNLATKETYKISDFKGKKVLLGNFAIWSVVSKGQQDQLKIFHKEDDSVVIVGIYSNPTETEDRVLKYVTGFGYDWYNSKPVKNMIDSLSKEFTNDAEYVPSAPVILICEDESARILQTGIIKTAKVLKAEVAKGCAKVAQ